MGMVNGSSCADFRKISQGQAMEEELQALEAATLGVGIEHCRKMVEVNAPLKFFKLIIWVKLLQIGIGWNYPPPSNSHHQDYYIFNRESL